MITIDRPERMNAIGPVTRRELVDAWTRFRDDDDALVGVLTGAGDDAFCAGGDLKAAFAGEHVVPVTPEERAAHARGERPGILGPTRWTDLHKPTIAAVNGVAYAGGLEWACWTDLCIADEHATFGVTCRRWNIGLGDGGTQRLPRIVGFRRAMELIITGRVIDARRGAADRPGQRGRPARHVPRARARAGARDRRAPPAGDPHRQGGGGRAASACPLDEGLRHRGRSASTGCSTAPEMAEGLRRFNERDHPDRVPGAAPATPGLARIRDRGPSGSGS